MTMTIEERPEAAGFEPEGDARVEAERPAEPEGENEGPDLTGVSRALLVAALSGTAAAAMTGGIFGSWPARAFSEAGLLFGVGWTWVVLRRRSARVVFQLLLLPIAVALGILSTVVGAGSESPGSLVGKAVRSGRLLRPPVPFDPGWRPILLVLFVIVGFSAAWVGAGLKRPKWALVLPLPIVILTAISQPAEGELVAGLLSGIPFIAAIGVLFAGEGGASQLTGAFELKRALRSFALLAIGVVALVLANQSNFLFPKPAYNPAQKPQKPKSIPLSEAEDKVLFEVDGPITGPWVIGALDVYDGSSWRLAPYDPKRLKPVPGDGVVNRDATPTLTVKFTTRDLGDTTTFPGVATPAKVSFPGQAVLYDKRTDTFRVKSGRLPQGFTYTESLPAYPTSAELQHADPAVPGDMKEFVDAPAPPPAVQDLLKSAPTEPWLRVDYLRSKLNQVVVASGAGVPGPVPPSKVQDLLVGKHEGTPYEIVAAEALLTRWAGVPSRIGFGFDQGQKESNVTTIRPKNAAQFLEIWFKNTGWIPIIGAPPKAKTSLNTDKNAKFTPTIQPSDDVAVEVYVPIQLENLRQLYQTIRDIIIGVVLPIALPLFALYLALPWLKKLRRTSKRRKWAVKLGPEAAVSVEYAELRDLATDLSVGDPYDTPLEYLARVVDDEEHAQFAWLVTRVLYGDLRGQAGPTEVEAAREMGDSLRRRMFRAQPFQTRALAVLSRASLAEPYTREVPNVELFKLPRRARTAGPRRRSRPPVRLRLRRVARPLVGRR